MGSGVSKEVWPYDEFYSQWNLNIKKSKKKYLKNTWKKKFKFIIFIKWSPKEEAESMNKRIHEAAPRVSLVKGERDVRDEVTSAC